jgi:hypothetical protein
MSKEPSRTEVVDTALAVPAPGRFASRHWGGFIMMWVDVQGSIEQLREVVRIAGVSAPRAAPEISPGIHVVHATIHRDEALEEIRALGVTVEVVRSEDELVAEARREDSLTREAAAIARATRRSP